MGILDDAIREHLDLKRKHGARDTELSQLEDDAFGTGDRPDPFAAGEVAPPATPAPPGLGGDPASEEPTRLVEPQASAAAPPAEAPSEAPPAAAPEPEAPATPAPQPAPPAEPAPAEPAPAGRARRRGTSG